MEKSVKKDITYCEIAEKLLADKLLLTALEFHTECIENGKDLWILRDFFSNPKNFESHTQEATNRLSRSGSQVTLDSLDLARYSEDGAGGDEKVAILEFELRKAKETINALRNNLTHVCESASSTPEKGSKTNISFASIKPHEQRALNFLINEYLLIQGYKLTSITFADENQNQDFDDWDDVGLNIAKPPELLHLYREGMKQTGQNQFTTCTQTDTLLSRDINYSNIVKAQELEIQKLESKLSSTEAYLEELKSANEQLQKEKNLSEAMNTIISTGTIQDTKPSDVCNTPERFEMIDTPISVFKKNDSDCMSNNSSNPNDWTSLNMPEKEIPEEECKEADFGSLSLDPYLKEVFTSCYVNVNDVDENIATIFNQEINLDTLVQIISEILPKIIPNIILNKREEVIPLLMVAIFVNSKNSDRDILLQQLFNLKKKPTESERLTILSAIAVIARYAGEQMVENEILPLCWLQLTNKHLERRLLIAEACTVLIPYVSSSIRNSLILSMLQEMLDDKEDLVRERILKALALLFSMCDDHDKYTQCEEIALNTLNDSSNSFIHLSMQVLFPVLARWALQTDLLTTSLLKKLLHMLNGLIKFPGSQTKNQITEKIHNVIAVIDNLLIFLLISAVSNENILSNIEKDMTMDIRPDFLKLCTPLTNPVKLLRPDYNCGAILYEFDKYIGDYPISVWPEIDWIIDFMLPDLVNNVQLIDFSQQAILEHFLSLFSHIFVVFGENFTKYKIRPILQRHIDNLEQVISSFSQYCPSLSVIPIHLAALSFIEDYSEISTVLKKFLCILPLCGTPLDCLEITIKKLCENQLQELVVDCLWAAVVHQSPLVKSAAASLICTIISKCNEDLLKSKVVGAIVTLASDNDALVKTAALPALGSLIKNCTVKEVRDKAFMQIQTFISETAIKENHSLLRQLIVTLGDIVNSSSSSFANDVILPQLVNYSNHMYQMTNQTRKVDLALALLEAYTHVVYSPAIKRSINGVVKSGLKYLDIIISDNQSLCIHHETVLAMLKECDANSVQSSPTSPPEKNSTLSQNVNQGVEEMRSRMSKIFTKSSITKPNTLPNLQNIFKKK
ncbi:RAB11-binding protein RELCH homolog [Rhynchophorus ferrugineus]|uniref:RAB11-binding protein RELCH homolog n=1 Tax=Rhynchophorus ferrugineus TaxID=354439 RepID=UPI003FCEC450